MVFITDAVGTIIAVLQKGKQMDEARAKTGHWIRVTDKSGYLVWECDKCGWQQRYNTNFCPNCGVKMVEPQERSE